MGNRKNYVEAPYKLIKMNNEEKVIYIKTCNKHIKNLNLADEYFKKKIKTSYPLS